MGMRIIMHFKAIKLSKILSIILIALFSIHFLLSISYPEPDKIFVENNESPIENINFKVKDSATWYFNGTGIYIDDKDPNYNWSKTASENDWCTGSGTWSDPFVIENVTINGLNSGNCITIRRSDKYFTIRNCTNYNSGTESNEAGLYLYQANNGILIKNNFSSNSNGIYLEYSYNNTIAMNNINNNNRNGIYTYISIDNTISDNNIISNSHHGIFFDRASVRTLIERNNITYNNHGIHFIRRGGDSPYNDILFNNISKNRRIGINFGDFRQFEFGNITGNFITNNLEDGIYIAGGVHNTHFINNIISNNQGMGIHLDYWSLRGCEYNIIHNNTITNNIADGIKLYRSNFNEISENVIKDNFYGIGLFFSNDLIIKNNRICSNIAGIYNGYNFRNNFTGNKFYANGFLIRGDLTHYSSITIDNSNLVNDKYIYYYIHKTNLNQNNFTNAGQVILINCSDSIISNLNVSKTTIGIHLYRSHNNTISNITASESTHYGVFLHSSNNNRISNNTLTHTKGLDPSYANSGGIFLYEGSSNNNITKNNLFHNSNYGIYIHGGCNGNLIYLNNLTGNFHRNLPDEKQARDATNSLWFYNSIGNYWDDYTGKDIDDDGIGDSPYTFSNNKQDPYPIWWDPPVFSLNAPSENQFFSIESPTFTITIEEGIADTMWYTIDNGKINTTFSGLTGKINQTEWDKKNEELVIIQFYLNDSRGYKNFAEIAIQKDLTAPVSSIDFIPHNGSNIINKTTLLILSANDVNGSGLSTIRYKINNSSWITYYTPFDLSNFDPGNYIITYQAIDNVGNVEAENTLLINLVDTSSQPEIPEDTKIPGYNLFIFIVGICIISKILIKKNPHS